MEGKELFKEVLDFFRAAYPHRDIALIENLVFVDGSVKFNIEGFNLLYNLKRLCNTLSDELI